MKNIKKYYGIISYQNKLKIIFYVVLFILSLSMIISGLVFSKFMTDEIYNRNREKLSILSLNVEDQFKDIEEITTEIHQNGTLQNHLITINGNHMSQFDRMQLESNISQELSWLLVNKNNVIDTMILDLNNKKIVGTDSNFLGTFNKKQFNSIIKKFPQNSRDGHWFIKKNLQSGLFIQNLYDTRSGSLKRVGRLVVNTNLTFINDFIKDSGIFSNNDFLVMENSTKYFTTIQDKNDKFIPFIKENKNHFSTNKSYEIININKKKYYVYSDSSILGQENFHFYYFLRANEMLKKIFQIEIILFILVALVNIFSFHFLNRYLIKLISPINKLAYRMKNFKGEADLENLRLLQPLPSVTNSDEIGILYSSFRDLIHEIENLVIKDYQAKILTQEIEYKFLQAQLDPHFLYNTLNSINFMALSKGDLEISEMVTSLSLIFRNKIANNDNFKTIQDELDVVEAYVKIQSVRFKSRLIFSQSVEIEMMNYLIPSLIVQPLIENAIKYGVETVNKPVTIKLEVLSQFGNLVINIKDNGPGFKSTKKDTHVHGIGIKNIRSRLNLTFNNEAYLTIVSQEDIETNVKITIPIKLLKKKEVS